MHTWTIVGPTEADLGAGQALRGVAGRRVRCSAAPRRRGRGADAPRAAEVPGREAAFPDRRNGSPRSCCRASRPATRWPSPSGCSPCRARTRAGSRLAVRARTTGLTAADVDRALTDDRSLLITWLNRGTLHLVRSEDYPWLHALTAPPLFTGSARRLAQEGVSPDAAERAVRRSSAPSRGGPAHPRAAAGPHCGGGSAHRGPGARAHPHAGLAARADRARADGRPQHAYVLVRDWLGEPNPVDRDAALAELARRYLAGHGPAGDRDLARWAGLPLRDARAGLAAIASELEEREDGLVDLAGRPAAAEMPPRDCSAPSTRCCSAGRRASRCWGRTRGSSPSTACSGPSRSCAAAPPPPGGWPAARWRSSPSAASPARTRPRSTTKRRTWCGSWPLS